MKNETVSYSCDRCGKKLKDSSPLNIVTSLDESTCWSRLHIQIIEIHGVNNNSNTEQADLCQPCAAGLLADALKRVRAGERATKGAETSEQEGW
jgi:hypothetical protein